MKNFWTRPVGVGLLFGAVGLLLTVVGLVRGEVPVRAASIAVALVLGGGVWFLVAWAVATAARDVEADVAAEERPAEAVIAASITTAVTEK